MAPLSVDPEAMFAAGSAVQAAGEGLAANLSILTAGFSAHTGVDRAGEVFGLAYQEKAEAVLKAAAAAFNACRKSGAVIQQGASNYSHTEAASTLGGGSGALQPPSPPAELAAPGPPGTWGPGQPPPPLWSLVQSFILDAWPDGDVAGLRAAASRWRAFGAAAKGVQGTLNASKTLFDSQHIPEGEQIDNALSEIGSSTATVGELCGSLADTIDTFANRVDHAQTAIRDLLRRIESLGNLGHDVMLIIDGDAWDEIKQIVKDINAVLQHLGQEARACEEAIKFLVQAADRAVVTCEKYARRGLVQFLGDDVGNPVATVADTWINAYEGVLKGAVGMGLGLVDLSPHWIAADPHGAAATWTGLVKNAWKESLINAAVNPKEFSEARLQELKGLVHAKDWSTARPGLGAGEVIFDGTTLIAPGLGEAGAAADGAGAAARGAGEEAEAAGGAAGRAGGEGAAGARGALTDITKAGGDVTKNLEGAAGGLPEIKAPPAGGTPVGLPSGKPLDAPVEATPHPPDAAPGAPHDPAAAPGPGAGSGPHEPAPGPAAGGPHDPVSAPAEAPVPASATAGGGPHEPVSAPAEAPPAPAGAPGSHDPVSAPAETPAAAPAGVAPHEPAAEPGEGPYDRAPASGPREPASVTPPSPHEPTSVPGRGPHEPVSVPLEGAHEPAAMPAEGPHAPASVPAGAAPLASTPAVVGDRVPSTIGQLAEHAPPAAPTSPGGSLADPATATPHSPSTASAPKLTPHSPPLGGRPAAVPAPGRSRHLPGDGSGGDRPKSPADGYPNPGEVDSPGHTQPRLPPQDSAPKPGEKGGEQDGDSIDSDRHLSSTDPLHADDLSALADYTGMGYRGLNEALRSEALDASQFARVEALKNALSKLPPYEGPVVRGTNLPAEVLAQYRPGEYIVEKAFLSTTRNPVVAQSSAFAGNVEFRIVSLSGRDVSAFSMFPAEQEILFPAQTRFLVLRKTIDPRTGRTIIDMVED
ncbi:ADP-ribosyltransferase [Mycobacterium seoulense]|uniref:ADP-ribosyltransferase n=1 Tax=Mycobacterium seoulense TaxID=386911 RepID=UPI003CF3A42A